MEKEIYDYKVDIYSLGLTFFMLLTGKKFYKLTGDDYEEDELKAFLEENVINNNSIVD